MPALISCHRSLHQPILRDRQAALTLLQESVDRKQELIVLAILEALETLRNDESAIALAQSLGQLSPMVMLDIWEKGNSGKIRILAIPVDSFDALLDRDRDFARRVLELESRQLQRFIRSVQPYSLSKV